MRGSPNPSDFWAKLKQDDDGTILEWHPLINHSAEVAAVTEAVLQRTILRKRLARLAGWDDLSDVHIARLSALAAIHDVGKVNNSFQGQAHDPGERSRGHVGPIIDVIGSDQANTVLPPLGVVEIIPWFETEDGLVDFLHATWAHHGKPVLKKDAPLERLWRATNGRDPLKELENLASHVRTWFPKAFHEADAFPANSSLQHAYNGALTLADWIASDTTFFGYAKDRTDPMPAARKKAAQVVQQLFLDPSRSRSALGDDEIRFDGVLENPAWDPHEIQQECLELPIYSNGSLTVLESDTGSGKTEAAVARFIRLYQNGLVDGMYFAVPTRSAATQLHDRITKITERLFSNEAHRPPVIQAVPGYIRADDQEGIPRPNFKVEWLVEDGRDMSARGWAAESSKRYLAGAIVVGTVDQVLFSALQVSHAHMRATSLLRHFLVVDEVHASDVYMTALMDMVLEQHLEAGGHALLMSATLGSSARITLATAGDGEPLSLSEAEKQDYPLLTHVDARRTSPIEVHGESSGSEKVVEPITRPIANDEQAIAALAADKARAGARVLIIRNKVDECRDVLQELENLLGADSDLLFKVNGISAPHHSRFAPDDRELLDQRIEEVFGKGSDQSGVIAVCTQTVEQSLDIDADVLITDLCPMDVLLQRIGRLHRHKRKRPSGFELARCIVLTPVERDFSLAILDDGTGRNGPHGLGTVYNDLRVIEATWQVLEDDNLSHWEIPRHNRLLVERATHPDRLQSIVDESGDRWEAHDRHIKGQVYADRHHTDYVGLKRHIPFGREEFADDLGHVKTRLGEDTYRVNLPQPLKGPFGAMISEFTLSEWQLQDVPEQIDPHEEKIEKARSAEGTVRFTFCGYKFKYDQLGLAKCDVIVKY